VPATLEKISTQVREYNPSADLTGIEEAYEFAVRAHEGQVRKTGEPFVMHPVETCLILAELHMDTATLIAALLHDVVEDSGVPLAQIRERFGDEVAELVDGVTKLGRIKFESLADAQSQNLRKMLMAMAKDIRVILIKLADRLHNMRTLSGLPPERRQAKALETMEIYAPLAHRLGIQQIKWELEDLAFYYLEPKTFHQVQKMVAESREARETYLYQVKDQLYAELGAIGIEARIFGRPKHLFSIYQKMTSRGKDFSEIYDLIALRVIVSSVKDCYGALGTVHSIWKPVPGRFKDYLAMPKHNMYQSLHTTVIGPAGRPLEIQIRTEEMHRTSEYGIAAHWRYKEGGKGDESFDERLAWLRQMLEWQTELKDPREFMEALKIDLFEDEVFVFTPKGDVFSLRRGSTPLDFAYAIHTEVGNHCVGAKVNGAIVSLNHELQMGDRIEILTNKNAHPSRDWLNIVRTSSARSKIRSHFSKVSRGDDLQKGRDELQKILRKQGLSVGSRPVEKALDAVSKEMNYVAVDDMVASIGAGKLSPKQVVGKVIKHMQKMGEKLPAAAVVPAEPAPVLPAGVPMTPPRGKRKSQTGVVVRGIEDVLVRLARCCTPVPGDAIIGFVTRGRGVSVHRADCPNATDLVGQAERIIEVDWDSSHATTYQVEIMIEALDRTRLLQDVTVAVTDAGVNILSANVTTDRHGISTMRFLFELGNLDRLPGLLAELRGIEGVFEATRMMPSLNTSKKRGRAR
jgi:guanosine-3',5'-bis(diphosphate) 3'-pyrophosphohydrolase